MDSLPATPKLARSLSETLRRRSLSASNPDVFRSCSTKRVLSNFADVFAGQLSQQVGVSTKIFKPDAKRRSLAEHSEPMNEHFKADKIFYESIVVDKVDFFVSHVWTASRWLKWLALSYYVNIKAAMAVALFTWLSAAAILVHRKGYMAYGGQSIILTPVLVWLPVGMFFVTFIFGHRMFPFLGEKRAWLDKLCIHQTRTDLKVLGVTALPEFVANSNRVLILCSETYFERLWCNAEVATFAVVGGTDRIDFMPLWLAPWVLVTIINDVFCMWLWNNKCVVLIPLTGNFVQQRLSFMGPQWISFLTQTFGIGLSLALSYVPAVLFNHVSFSAKIKLHDVMFQQISAYKLQDARCAIESDRAEVERQIGDLFSEMKHLGLNPDSPSEDPIERFNYFINNDFADSISVQVGDVGSIPWHICLLAFMPLNFEALADVLGCDGEPCDTSAVAEGFTSTFEYIATNALMWSHGVFLIYPTTYIVMLRGLNYIQRFKGRKILWTCSSMLVIAASYLYMGFAMGAVCGVVSTAVISQEPGWYAGWFACLAALTHWNYFLFGQRRRP